MGDAIATCSGSFASNSSMNDCTSPYFPHNGDRPGFVLVSHLLIASNINTLKRAMIMALNAQSKQSIDGSICPPSATDILYLSWFHSGLFHKQEDWDMATSHDGSKYFLTTIDDFTTATWVYLMKTEFLVGVKIKHHADGIIQRLNARFEAKGPKATLNKMERRFFFAERC